MLDICIILILSKSASCLEKRDMKMPRLEEYFFALSFKVIYRSFNKKTVGNQTFGSSQVPDRSIVSSTKKRAWNTLYLQFIDDLVGVRPT